MQGITVESQNKQKQKSKMNWNEVNGTSTNDIWSMLFFGNFFLLLPLLLCIAFSWFLSVNFLKYNIFGKNCFFLFCFSYLNVIKNFGIFTVFGAWNYGHRHIVLIIKYGYFNNIQPMIQYQIYQTMQVLKHFFFISLNVSGVWSIHMWILNINYFYRIMSIKIRSNWTFQIWIKWHRTRNDHMIYETKSALMIILDISYTGRFCLLFCSTYTTQASRLVYAVSTHTLRTNDNNSKCPNCSKLTVLLCWLLNKYSTWFVVVLVSISYYASIEHRTSNSAFQCLFDMSVWQHDRKKNDRKCLINQCQPKIIKLINRKLQI